MCIWRVQPQPSQSIYLTIDANQVKGTVPLFHRVFQNQSSRTTTFLYEGTLKHIPSR